MKPFYDRYWKNKEELFDLTIKWPTVKNFFPNSANGKLLDYGCGKGALLEKIVSEHSGLSIHGLDISKDALSAIRKKFPKGSFHTIQDGSPLPYKNNYFDYILATDVLEHVYDTERIYFELSRILKPGGKLLITVPYHGKLKNIIITIIAFDYYFNPYQPHIRFYTKNNLKKCVKNAHLSIYKFGYYGRIYPLSQAMYAYCRK